MKPGDVVFLSASVPHREPWAAEARPRDIEEVIVSVARAVFARKGRLLFGGHPSVSPLLADIAGEYYAINPHREIRPIVTVQSRFFDANLPRETWHLSSMGWSAIEWTAAEGGRNRSLEIMRETMLLDGLAGAALRERNDLRPPIAMIAVGGMEGIRDEAIAFLRVRARWPQNGAKVFAFATPGGAAARLVEPLTVWGERLWPDQQPRPVDFDVLRSAAKEGGLVGAEQAWKQWLSLQNIGMPTVELQPYGGIAQWILDRGVYD